jgi:hypothetical protein
MSTLDDALVSGEPPTSGPIGSDTGPEIVGSAVFIGDPSDVAQARAVPPGTVNVQRAAQPTTKDGSCAACAARWNILAAAVIALAIALALAFAYMKVERSKGHGHEHPTEE